MAKGDIVLISFTFTDLTGNKVRPVVIPAENKSKETDSLKENYFWETKSNR